MDRDNMTYFCDCVERALFKLMPGTDRLALERYDGGRSAIEGRKFLAIVGIVGYLKGRMNIQFSEKLAYKLYEDMNGEPVDEEMNLCLYLAEFANMLTGNGVTDFNNAYKVISFRLTPPAVFVGDNLESTAAEVAVASLCYRTNYGDMRIEIGFA